MVIKAGTWSVCWLLFLKFPVPSGFKKWKHTQWILMERVCFCSHFWQVEKIYEFLCIKRSAQNPEMNFSALLEPVFFHYHCLSVWDWSLLQASLGERWGNTPSRSPVMRADIYRQTFPKQFPCQWYPNLNIRINIGTGPPNSTIKGTSFVVFAGLK